MDDVYVDSLNITDIKVYPQTQKQCKQCGIPPTVQQLQQDQVHNQTIYKMSIFIDSTEIHILGSSTCIKKAKDSLHRLIPGYLSK